MDDATSQPLLDGDQLSEAERAGTGAGAAGDSAYRRCGHEKALCSWTVPEVTSFDGILSSSAQAQLRRYRHEIATSCGPDSADYEQLLGQLWRAAMPGEQVPAVPSAEWKRLGFQRDQPHSDLRGAGKLGLRVLVAFVRDNGDVARRVLHDASEPTYDLAISSLNVTFELAKLFHLLPRAAVVAHKVRSRARAAAGAAAG